ncbi:HTH-type transcriptional regulator CdhR [Streptomyces sp. RB5]|uniref:HTH-type transcriptional regulator CdhR n=1 Tax=Streptomyces smaragdinus TaxID=2585196 RepID=A0A7K0CN14_9ACTN|nr:helix-turn-helix domain-containing protein [Streptomyces smaragdinus]MQY14829.1 HTH-type transcriptional regulator CdhR [Streptomyces smaragdinus]
MLKNIACVLVNGVNAFELGVVCEVFGLDRTDAGLPAYDFAVVAAEGSPVRVNPGLSVDTPYGIERLAAADLIALPAGDSFHLREFPEELLQALRDAVGRGARILTICSGAFLAGAAGLLDGRRCTTHWRYTGLLAEAVPRALIEPDVLYVADGPVITSAGTAAGIDACLALVREEQGTKVANGIARRMVVPPHREGGQTQFIESPVIPPCRDDVIGDALRRMQAEIDREHPVERLAARAHLAPRTFARRFQQETGTTPLQWLLGQRVLLAQQLLEESDLTVDAIAARTGFGNAAALRQQFVRRVGTTPNAYRRTFQGTPAV